MLFRSKQLGQTAYQVREQYAGRKQEMAYELSGQRDRFTGLGATIAEAEAAAKSGDAAAQTRLADANTRLSQEAENIAKSMMEMNPALAFEDVTAASKQIAIALSQGDLSSAQQKMLDALGDIPDEAQAVAIAFERLAKQTGTDTETLKRSLDPKTLERQQFVASREGQRYGVLAEIAPDMLKKFSGTRLGQSLGQTSDFLSGQGGAYSKAFKQMGGLTSMGLRISAAPGLIQTAMGDPTTSTGAAQYAGLQSAASTFGTGLQLASQSGPAAPFVAAEIGRAHV